MISKVELYTLGIISHKPMHGYELSNFFDDLGVEVINKMKKSSIYKVLRRLEKADYLTGKYEIESEGHPKKIFSVTKSGKDYFRKQIRTLLLENCPSGREFWMGIKFSHKNFTREEFISILQNKKEKVEKHAKRMLKKKEQAEKRGIIQKFPFYFQPLGRMGKQIHDIQKETIDKLIELARKSENSDTFIKEGKI